MTTATKTTDRDKRVPRESLRFPGAVFSLQAASSSGDADAAEPRRAFRMVARTGGPVHHWYWGTCYHDLNGMAIARDRVPIDWLHRDDEVIGFADGFEVLKDDQAGGLALVATGELVPFTDDDRAAEIIHKAGRGVPYEASIDFDGDGIRIEELSAGVAAEVNGQTVTGPALIFRDWPLRGIAVCPHGYDQDTRTEFSTDAADAAVSVTLFSRGKPKMTKETTTPAETPEQNRANFAAELKRYTERFGSKGAEYFADGLDWPTALEAHLAATEKKLADAATAHAAELADMQTNLDQAAAKLSSLQLGETEPVESTPTREGNSGKTGLAQFISIGGKAK